MLAGQWAALLAPWAVLPASVCWCRLLCDGGLCSGAPGFRLCVCVLCDGGACAWPPGRRLCVCILCDGGAVLGPYVVVSV